MNGWQLATINKNDLESILAIEKNSFRWPWGRISFEGELSCQDSRSLMLKKPFSGSDDRIIAYVILRLIAEELHLLKIAVTPAWRGCGIASALLSRCFLIFAQQGVTVVHLEVRPSNFPAIELYNKLGFEVVGRRPAYYMDSKEDALLMTKYLKEDK